MSTIAIRSTTLAKSTLLSRGPMICQAYHFQHLPIASSSRSFSVSSRARLQVDEPKQASLALRTDIKEKEERSSQKIVGGTGKGVEGPHYQDQVHQTQDILTNESTTGAWTMMNPIYTEQELDTVKVVGRVPVTVADKAAHRTVKFLRKAFDFLTQYKAIPISQEVLKQNPIPIEELRSKGLLLSHHKWLFRFILLESIAGVPGMVGGTLRHLRSMRLLRRDGGWIHTLLEEAENERMHLLTFMTMAQPTLFTRALVLGAQGVFYNAFFLTYLFSPKTAHRFVGALEEEAVRTYTHCIEDLENNLIPEWNDVAAPRIAIDYWRLPQDAKLLDVIRAVRADEATHRFVNHSLANLDQQKDFNPFALVEADAQTRGEKWGFTREESANFAREQQQKLQDVSTKQIADQ
ncbi:alternative oxidase, mitochondrial [Kwoniella pini CBS 10737]|uniref:Alternative oxidase n=1 Tax=Kwoniella pini CBS 10737 TaxID=1296096 RepID=A0A1B9I2N9_9TREE|nr:alternative oxidase, mitochondrial [Kwoniella pini CBS 10737]OCF49711.1 alternative oxidase, mitochondrial [Kwoniella pini CBS 10737]